MIDLTAAPPPGEATHWTAAAMAKAIGISVSSVQRIWRAHGLKPHQVRQFKLSNDPAFATKLRDVVGLYVDPPDHAVVLSIDEKSQIQALDRTQPGLPMKKGRAGTMTHDYKRHGTTTLFAALDVLEGKVIGRCMKRHRHQEFIRFLDAIETMVPSRKAIHAIVDNYATHKHPTVRRMARPASALDFPFHPNIGILAQCRRGLLRQAHTAPPQARRVPFRTLNCKPPSFDSSTRPIMNQSPSSGPPIRVKSSVFGIALPQASPDALKGRLPNTNVTKRPPVLTGSSSRSHPFRLPRSWPRVTTTLR